MSVRKIAVTNENLEKELLARIAYQRYEFLNASSQTISDNDLIGDFAQDEFIQLIVKCFKDEDFFPAAALRSFPLIVILDYLEKTHQLYIKKRLPEIEMSICNLQGNLDISHPIFRILHVFFKKYQKHLIEHIWEEEQTLFPYVRFLLGTQEFQIPRDISFSKLGSYCLKDFLHDHSDTEDEITCIRKVIRSYEPKDRTKSPFRVLLTQLKTFELDLNIHSRIEEEVLIPKALKLEERIKPII